MATLLLVLVLTFADSDDWSRVKVLTVGADVTVIQSDMKSTRGTLDGASDNEIVVAGVHIAKDPIVRISVHKTRHRVVNSVLLGVVGGLIGGAATRFGVACAETNDGCHNSAMFAVAGAAGGAAIGALALPDTSEVYRVKATAPRKPGL